MLTNVYVDGFNLYYGALKGTPHKWLDLEKLASHLLPHDEIGTIRYFTAHISAQTDARAPQRQQTYLRALALNPRITVHLGSFMAKKKLRPLTNGGGYVEVHDTEEKGSDVNLATYLVHDGHLGRYEQAAVLSNDSDLRLPIQIVRNELRLRVGLLNPHKRVAFGLKDVADFYRPIRRGVLAASQLPPTMSDGHGVFRRPVSW